MYNNISIMLEYRCCRRLLRRGGIPWTLHVTNLGARPPANTYSYSYNSTASRERVLVYSYPVLGFVLCQYQDEYYLTAGTDRVLTPNIDTDYKHGREGRQYRYIPCTELLC